MRFGPTYRGTRYRPLRSSRFQANLSFFSIRLTRWASETLFALAAMTACSQHIELRGAYAPRMQGKWDV